MSSVACEVGDRFAIREEGRTIGSGVVTRVVA
jgi:translation elongation factor EF-Tu-like GTPase